MIGLAGLASADSLLIALRQTGIVRRLPELPGDRWGANQVVTSSAAFALGVPDASLGAAAFAIAAALTSRLGAGAARRRPLAALGLLVTATGIAAAGASYLWQMLVVKKQLCAYCLVASGVGFTLLPMAISEVARRDGEA